MTLCDIDTDTMLCRLCGRLALRPDLRRKCRPGLGDYVSLGLAYAGITEELVAKLVGECSCPERREWLNRLGRTLGIGRVDPPT